MSPLLQAPDQQAGIAHAEQPAERAERDRQPERSGNFTGVSRYCTKEIRQCPHGS